MNVLLNGATAGSNFGDFLFAKAFQDYVGGIVGKENVYWYNSRYAMSDFYASRLNNNRTALKNIDAFLRDIEKSTLITYESFSKRGIIEKSIEKALKIFSPLA